MGAMQPKSFSFLIPLLLCALVVTTPSTVTNTASVALPVLVPEVASYTIAVTLDPQTHQLSAHQVLTYTNTTTEPIPDLVFHLYLNAFRSQESLFLRESVMGGRGSGWSPDYPGWIEVQNVQLAGGAPLQLVEIEDGTLARADLPAPVGPGESVVVELDFLAQLPRVLARTGFAGDFFIVGQWFPKLGVWQDGAWNAYPFYPYAEFYADFGRYDVTITLPADYVTAATGLPVAVETHGDGTQTVRYQADGVIDFAWAASPHFRSATRTVAGTEIVYMYMPEHEWTVERALDVTEAALTHYGRWYSAYPYPRLTVVDVPEDGEGAGGMEYPMLVTGGTMGMFGAGSLPGRLGVERSPELVIAHEVGHQWWQSTVAFNEVEEPWLDEGLTDYSTVRLLQALYSRGSALDGGRIELGYLQMRRMEYLSMPHVPMAGGAWEFGLFDYGIAAYSKPVVALMTLERTLGGETMLEILSTFYQRYRFAHPTAADLRAVAEEVSGQDLAWFFDGLAEGTEVVNYTISALDAHSVTVLRQGELAVPTEVEVTFADGSRVLEPWSGESSELTLAYPDRAEVVQAQIDPQGKLVVDLRWADNGLARQFATNSWLALVTRLLYNLQDGLLAWGGW